MTSTTDVPLGTKSISGSLGTKDIILATLAYCAPLAASAGYLSLSVGFGSGIYTPLSFLVTMVIMLLFSVGYTRMTRRVQNPGAFYAYITLGLGRPAGLGTSFVMLFSYGAIALGFYAFAGIITKEYIEGFVAFDLPWWAYSLLFWASVGFFAYFHIDVSARILSYVLVLEVLAVVIYNVAVLSQVGLSNLDFTVFSISGYLDHSLGLGILFTVILFVGFEATAIYREEVVSPEKTIPNATYLVVVFIGIFYALTSWMMIQAIGVDKAQAASAEDPAGIFLVTSGLFVGQGFNAIVAIFLLTSAFAAHLAIQNVIVRYVYSLSRDGVLPSFLGVAHERHASPHRASVATSAAMLIALAALIVAGLTPEQIYAWFGGMGTYGILFAMLLTSAACLAFFRRNSDPTAFWQETVTPVIATLLLAAANYIALMNFDALTGEGGVLSLIMMAAVFLFFVVGLALALWHRGNNPAVYARIGRQG